MLKSKRQKRRQSQLIVSSSDSESDEERTEEAEGQAQQGKDFSDNNRHSERLESRRKRKGSFQLPSRSKIWDTIPSENSPMKYMSPRKTVSNFTRVYNTYNFDYYEDSSGDSEEDFIKDSSEDSEDTSLSADEEKASPSRIKNFHRRIRVESSSSDEHVESKDRTSHDKDDGNSPMPDFENVDKSFEDNSCVQVQESSKTVSLIENDLETIETDCHFNVHESNESSEDEITPAKRRKISVLDSEDDNDEKDNEEKAVAQTAITEKEIVSSGSSGGNSSAEDESESDSGESRAAKLKRKSLELFNEFKAIQAKRKLFLVNK